MSALFVFADGQYAGGRLFSMTAAGSCGRSRYSTSRPTELETKMSARRRLGARNALQVEFLCGPEPARPVDAHGE
jgi:hypothetical protein